MKEFCADMERRLLSMERTLLAALLALLVLLSFLQVVLRGLFSCGLLWADIFLRHLVLLIGLLGACAAAAEGQQFAVDALARLFPRRGKALAGLCSHGFAATVCLLLARAASTFALEEFRAGRTLLRALGADVPQWLFAALVPAGFLLLALHELLKTAQDAAELRE